MNQFKWWVAAGRLSGLGFTLAVVIVLGLFAGVFLDGKLGTSPLFTLVLLLLSIVGGFVYIIKEVRETKWK